MALYQPGRQKPQGQSERRRSGGYSAVPRGRQYQLDFHLGQVVVDKSKDIGREDFAEEVIAARNDSTLHQDEVDLLEKYGNLESGVAVWLGWKVHPDGRNFRLNLTRCTELELNAFRDAMLCAVEEARPEARRRDDEAKRAEDDGFYGLFRVTRSAPQVVDFGRKKSEHNQELSVRREGVHPVGDAPSDAGRDSDDTSGREGAAEPSPG